MVVLPILTIVSFARTDPRIVHMPFEIKDDSIILFLRIYNDNSLKLPAVSSDPVGAMMTSRKFASSSSLASIENHDH